LIAPKSPEGVTTGLAWRVVEHAEIGSTNDEARAAALAGDRGRLVVVADRQTAGRGRRGRGWLSPPGNLYASLLVIDPCPPPAAALLSFVAGLAMASAVERLGGEGFALKWPNDLMWRGAKAAGVLVEGLNLSDRRFAAVMGFGINCAAAPGGLPQPTADLQTALGRPIAPREALAALLPALDEALATFAGGDGFAAIREAWLGRAAGLEGPLRVNTVKGRLEGGFAGIDERGRLQLRRPDGTLNLVDAGEIELVGLVSAAGAGTV